MSSYIILTSARNEEHFISETIESVLAQTIIPREYVIVSDGSTDRTDEIIIRYAKKYPAIKYLRTEVNQGRNFGSKARAINWAYESVKTHVSHKFVAILDADMILTPDYYEKVLTRFLKNNDLGIAGGVLSDRRGSKNVKLVTSVNWSVSGAIQVFRKQCFQDIGGYFPVSSGIDAAAEVMARMKGWKVQAFPEIEVLHGRALGWAAKGLLRAAYRRGQGDFFLGYHPLFFVSRCMRRVHERPYILGSIAMLLGYISGKLSGKKRIVPDDFVQYLRHEQLERLVGILRVRRPTLL